MFRAVLGHVPAPAPRRRHPRPPRRRNPAGLALGAPVAPRLQPPTAPSIGNPQGRNTISDDAAIKARDALLSAIAQQAQLATMNSDPAALEVLARAYATIVSAPVPDGASGTATVHTIPLQRDNPSEEPAEVSATSESPPQVQTRAGEHQIGLCLELEP